MNKNFLTAIIAVIVLLGAYIVVANIYKTGYRAPNQNPPAGNGGQANSVTANAVTIENFAFNPQTITVKRGASVTWTNNDLAPHQIASDPHPAREILPALFSDSLSKGQAYTFTFDKAGNFGYHCHIHPSMKGTIVVEE